jgi:dipeptidyl aminopeptidase/acylaminoacyl peptidase
MTAPTHLERDLSDWFSETAMPHTPDYADEILDQTRRIRQRPPWSFLGRWLPDQAVGLVQPLFGPAARRVALLVALGLLIAAFAALAAFVGSRPKLIPPAFGPAGNGLLAYGQTGAILLLDPDTLVAKEIVGRAGGEHHAPRWSLDGTRLALIRSTGGADVIVVVDPAGGVIATSATFRDIDSDSVMWSPDGKQIAIAATGRSGRGIYLVDAGDGTDRDLGVKSQTLEMYWRPPRGEELLFRSSDATPGLAIVSLADGTVRPLIPGAADGATLRPLGWMPDGRAILYQTTHPENLRTVIRDLETGEEVQLDLLFGHVSNDGRRIVGMDRSDRPCILEIGAAECVVIPNAVGWVGSTSASVTWSPDDRWIAIFEGAESGDVWLVDSTGATSPRQVGAASPSSWQRTFPDPSPPRE